MSPIMAKHSPALLRTSAKPGSSSMIPLKCSKALWKSSLSHAATPWAMIWRRDDCADSEPGPISGR